MYCSKNIQYFHVKCSGVAINGNTQVPPNCTNIIELDDATFVVLKASKKNLFKHLKKLQCLLPEIMTPIQK